MRQRTFSPENLTFAHIDLPPAPTLLGGTMNAFTATGLRHMSMGKPPGRPIAEALMHRAGPDAGAAEVANASVETWREIEAALSPIIGQRGVGALYARAVRLTSAAYPWLEGPTKIPLLKLNIEALRTVLSDQLRDEAAAASGAVLNAFHALLTHLIGALLTEQLLRSVWARFLSSDAAQEFPS